MPTVYDPIKVGTMWLKNRFAEAPTVKNFAEEAAASIRELCAILRLRPMGLG